MACRRARRPPGVTARAAQSRHGAARRPVTAGGPVPHVMDLGVAAPTARSLLYEIDGTGAGRRVDPPDSGGGAGPVRQRCSGRCWGGLSLSNFTALLRARIYQSRIVPTLKRLASGASGSERVSYEESAAWHVPGRSGSVGADLLSGADRVSRPPDAPCRAINRRQPQRCVRRASGGGFWRARRLRRGFGGAGMAGAGRGSWEAGDV